MQRGGDSTQGVVTNLGSLIRRIRMKTRLLDGVVKEIARISPYVPAGRESFGSGVQTLPPAPAPAKAKVASPNNWREDERVAWEFYNGLSEDDKKYVREFCPANPTARTLLLR